MANPDLSGLWLKIRLPRRSDLSFVAQAKEEAKPGLPFVALAKKGVNPPSLIYRKGSCKQSVLYKD
ncbi:MAG: hypothetical protein ABII09_06260 [Planctomycetota bacterium]